MNPSSSPPTSPSTTTTTTNSPPPPPSSPKHQHQHQHHLSTNEKIALRVSERNSWPTFYEPSVIALAKMMSNYALRKRVPSKEQLDIILPVRDVDWELLRCCDDGEIVRCCGRKEGEGGGGGGGGGEGEGIGEDVSIREGGGEGGGKSMGGTIRSTWIGHASLLVQMGGWNILTDPVFGERCSPLPAGPKRYRRPAFTIRELMQTNSIPIDIVLISHNHYDHLDLIAVRKIARLSLQQQQQQQQQTVAASTTATAAQQQQQQRRKRPLTFVVPLGLRAWFHQNVPDSKRGGNRVVELDWHESWSSGDDDDDDVSDGAGDTGSSLSSIKITGLPMQHWSSRKGWDKDKTLWCGFAVTTTTTDARDTTAISGGEAGGGEEEQHCLKFMFSGDTGYFDGVTKIGEKYGPFDLAAIPIGAYAPRSFMKPAHMNPYDAVQFAFALRARRAVPIHWGTFQLTIEPVMEPVELLRDAMEKKQQQQQQQEGESKEGVVEGEEDFCRKFDGVEIGETVVVVVGGGSRDKKSL